MAMVNRQVQDRLAAASCEDDLKFTWSTNERVALRKGSSAQRPMGAELKGVYRETCICFTLPDSSKLS